MTSTYRIRGRGGIAYHLPELAWFVLIVGGSLFLHRTLDDWTTPAGLFASLVLLLVGGTPLMWTLWTPEEVSVSEDGTCEFRSPLRRRTVRAQGITKVTSEDGTATLHYDGGRIRIPTGAADFDDFIGHVVELNPAVELPRWAWRVAPPARPSLARGDTMSIGAAARHLCSGVFVRTRTISVLEAGSACGCRGCGRPWCLR